MTGFLLLNGSDVPVVAGTQVTEERIGDIGRVVSLQMRTDTVGTVRVIRTVTTELTAAEKTALQAVLRAAGTVTVGGTIIDDESPAPEFTVVGPVEIDPITADAWVLSFELHEAGGQ
jgi:hypothetical protein